MEPSTCPESISDNPKSISDNPKSALGWLSQFAYFFEISLSNIFSKKLTSHSPSGISSKSKKLLQVILYLSAFSKKFGLEDFFLKIPSSFLIFELFSSEFYQNPLFHFKPSGSHFTETLFQTSTPCRVPSR